MSVGDRTDQIIRRPTSADIDFIVENIREEDVIEVKAAGGKSIRECITDIPNLEENSWVWEYDQKPVCIFGVNPFGRPGEGLIWMLATTLFDDHFMVFAVACKSVVEDMVRPFKYVFNYVYVENRKSIRWLKWLGFTVREPEPVGVNGAMFCRFEMESSDV